MQYTSGTQAVVYIGQYESVAGTYDEDGLELTPPVFTDALFDVMSNDVLDFGSDEVFPVTALHGFLGHIQPAVDTNPLDDIE